MCPLRIILVFLSATLAGYFAWKTVRSSREAEHMISGDSITAEKTMSKHKEGSNLRRMIEEGFWVFVDMASGRYLWRNLRVMNEGNKGKSC